MESNDQCGEEEGGILVAGVRVGVSIRREAIGLSNLSLILVNTVGKGSGGRLIDDAKNL